MKAIQLANGYTVPPDTLGYPWQCIAIVFLFELGDVAESYDFDFNTLEAFDLEVRRALLWNARITIQEAWDVADPNDVEEDEVIHAISWLNDYISNIDKEVGDTEIEEGRREAAGRQN